MAVPLPIEEHMAVVTEFADTFKARYEPVFGVRDRWHTFEWLVQQLARRRRPIRIIECGTAQYRTWQECGNSTDVWDWLVDRIGGRVYSLDQSGDGIAQVIPYVHNVQFYQARALDALVGMSTLVAGCDLLYLDMDWTTETNAVEGLEHVGCLAAAWPYLPSGALIGIDDCYDDDTGKHWLCQRFFAASETPCVHPGFTAVWQKP